MRSSKPNAVEHNNKTIV